MSGLAPDILARIDLDFADPVKRQTVRAQLASLWDTPLNVGPEQLARAVLVVAAGDLVRLEQIIDGGFGGDPRDLILRAVALSGERFAYGAAPFDNP